MARIELGSEERKAEWDKITFEDVYNRLFMAKVVTSQTELAALLKLGRAAVSYVSKKGYVPREWKTRFERAGLSWDWVAYGDGSKYNANHLFATGAVVSIPKIVDIKDGQIEKNKDVFEYPIHKTFLTQLNINAKDLGYISQSGSAMQPAASDGDVWIIDMTNKVFDIGCTYVVKLGESASIGVRIVVDSNGIDGTVTLAHGNTALPPQVVKADLVQVVGRCVLKVCKVT